MVKKKFPRLKTKRNKDLLVSIENKPAGHKSVFSRRKSHKHIHTFSRSAFPFTHADIFQV